MEARKKKIIVCPGHNTRSKGSQYHGRIEHYECLKICDYLADYLSSYNNLLEVELITGSLSSKVSKINSNSNVELALDVHLNSSKMPSVSGTETLHSGSMKSILLAEKIHDELLACLELKDRGVKKGYYRLDPTRPVLYFLRKTKCPAVIPEPLFMSNESDLKVLNHEMIAEAIGLGILSYLREITDIGM